jgi:hypothetical protein
MEDGKIRLSRRAAQLQQLGITDEEPAAPVTFPDEPEIGKIYRCGPSSSLHQRAPCSGTHEFQSLSS